MPLPATPAAAAAELAAPQYNLGSGALAGPRRGEGRSPESSWRLVQHTQVLDVHPPRFTLALSLLRSAQMHT